MQNEFKNWYQDKTSDEVAKNPDNGNRGLNDALDVEGQAVEEDLPGLVELGAVRHQVVVDVVVVGFKRVVHVLIWKRIITIR